MPVIERLSAIEILDSRGKPTVKARCVLEGGASATASVPSGASTGKAEALELRDVGERAWFGMGCGKAVANVKGVIADALRRKPFEHQSELDAALVALDGTPNKAQLGANAILAVSLAFARAHAAARGKPLYAHFADMIGQPLRTLPRMTINLFSGGKHAGGQVPIQDVLVVPSGAETIRDGLAVMYAVFQAAVERIKQKYDMRPLRADEGGLAPPAASVEALLDDATDAVLGARCTPGGDVDLALDVASSHFYSQGLYDLGCEKLTPQEMVGRVRRWVDDYAIVSVEDGLAEDDWAHWPLLRQAVSDKAIVLGDDFLCTNPRRIRRAVEANAANALLLKVNQIGTLTEAAEALALARDAGWQVTVSARSGETEDDWLADLAVGWGGDQIKVGSITQSERLAKYNRLLEIEAETKLPIVAWPGAHGKA